MRFMTTRTQTMLAAVLSYWTMTRVFHSLWMTFPSQCNKSNFPKWILHLLFAKTQAFYSYYNAQNEIKWLYLPASNPFSSQLAVLFEACVLFVKMIRHEDGVSADLCTRGREYVDLQGTRVCTVYIKGGTAFFS
ncbi:uncharacterized protein LOC126725007 [Quercus robur]|uniref:uncharacterized protein LOC126725007 n=1 Tax=Quercus robur TaxID=38942 RepID=UPI0021627CE8|nr:uncharacterized protein LOC126725007 [Quercus robur]